MKKAILYIRVSTDEQADKGYSQRYQEETLRRYCVIKEIAVVEVLIEDFTARTFQRPRWQQLLVLLKKHRGIADIVLFTNWSRFSRNTADAYLMIRMLGKLGVDQQAIEQPLDLTVPENKLMLAVYLAQPEVENERRGLNIRGGMRRARKEGRWMGKAPLGYRNKTEDEKKSIVVCPDQGPIMKWVFEELAKGIHTTRSIYLQAREKGLLTHKTKKHPGGKPVDKTSFWNALRNPVYTGLIVVQAYKGEEDQLVSGRHEALISQVTFQQVQDVLTGRHKPMRTKLKVDDRFPLRGYLQCQQCGRLLTASSSRGRKQYYSYYHCFNGCNERHTAESVNDFFVQELASWKPHPAVTGLYKLVLDDVYGQGEKQRLKRLQQHRDELGRLEVRKVRIRKMRIDGDLEADDYAAEKKEVESAIVRLESEALQLATGQDIRSEMQDALHLLTNINERWTSATTEWKRNFIGSMFPEKLEFTGLGFRTARLNEVAKLIFSLDAGFSQNKNGTGVRGLYAVPLS